MTLTWADASEPWAVDDDLKCTPSLAPTGFSKVGRVMSACTPQKLMTMQRLAASFLRSPARAVSIQKKGEGAETWKGS